MVQVAHQRAEGENAMCVNDLMIFVEEALNNGLLTRSSEVFLDGAEILSILADDRKLMLSSEEEE